MGRVTLPQAPVTRAAQKTRNGETTATQIPRRKNSRQISKTAERSSQMRKMQVTRTRSSCQKKSAKKACGDPAEDKTHEKTVLMNQIYANRRLKPIRSNTSIVFAQNTVCAGNCSTARQKKKTIVAPPVLTVRLADENGDSYDRVVSAYESLVSQPMHHVGELLNHTVYLQ